jgi:hypothetical protein
MLATLEQPGCCRISSNARRRKACIEIKVFAIQGVRRFKILNVATSEICPQVFHPRAHRKTQPPFQLLLRGQNSWRYLHKRYSRRRWPESRRRFQELKVIIAMLVGFMISRRSGDRIYGNRSVALRGQQVQNGTNAKCASSAIWSL